MNSKIKNGVTAALMSAGVMLVISAASLYAYNLWDEDRASKTGFRISEAFVSDLPRQSGAGDSNAPAGSAAAPPSTAGEPSISIDNNRYIGLISIPALGVTLPVMDSWSYPNLRISPCRYSGSVEGNDIVIAAHNYSRFFGNIFKLAKGDRVVFTDAAGIDHHYAVAEVTALPPASIRDMTDSGFALTMFTCTYSGRARVTVRCDNAA